MSENQNRGTVDYTQYASMSTEALEEILRLDAEAPEGQASDGELILYVMEVLAQRKRNAGHTGKTALEAFESFKQNYMPETAPMKTKSGSHRWFRALAATAAVLVLLFAGSVTAKAFGFNIWKTVVQWTQETFHFGDWGNSDAKNNLPYASLQEALAKGNTPSWLVPTCLPEGYELSEIQVEQTPLKKIYKALYTNGVKSLSITVQDYLNQSPYYVEQNDGLVEKYEVYGMTCYLFLNCEYGKAVWLHETYECTVSGEVTIDELKQMIDSIQKG